MRTNTNNIYPWGVTQKRRKVLGQRERTEATDKHIHRDTKAYTKGIYAKFRKREAG